MFFRPEWIGDELDKAFIITANVSLLQIIGTTKAYLVLKGSLESPLVPESPGLMSSSSDLIQLA